MVAEPVLHTDHYVVRIRVWHKNRIDDIKILNEKIFHNLMEAHLYIFDLYRTGITKPHIEIRHITIAHIETPDDPDEPDNRDA